MVHQFHPVADLFPLLTGEAFQQLAADIKKNGLREPILLDREGRIIDGRNRYRACNLAGVEPLFVAWDGQGTLPEVALSLNLHRRHLNESQRAMVAARTVKWMENKALERQRQGRRDLGANLRQGQGGRSGEKAGGLLNVSRRSVVHAAKVLHHGCEKLIKLVDTGELAVSAAARLASLGHENQEKALAERAQQLAERPSRRGHLPPASAPVYRAGPGAFGVLGKDADEDRMLLWVETRALNFVIKTLKRRGLRYIERRPAANRRLPRNSGSC
jgi:hypothetical protein